MPEIYFLSLSIVKKLAGVVCFQQHLKECVLTGDDKRECVQTWLKGRHSYIMFQFYIHSIMKFQCLISIAL